MQERLQNDLDALRKQMRWTRTALVAAAVSGTALLTASALRPPAPQEPSALRCTQLELVGPDGTVLATLGADDAGAPSFDMRGAHGYVKLALSAEGAGLASGNSNGVSYLGVTEGGPYLNFRGKNLRNGIWAGVTSEGSAGFRAYGETLKVGVLLEVDANGEPVLRLSDPSGKELRELP